MSVSYALSLISLYLSSRPGTDSSHGWAKQTGVPEQFSSHVSRKPSIAAEPHARRQITTEVRQRQDRRGDAEFRQTVASAGAETDVAWGHHAAHSTLGQHRTHRLCPPLSGYANML